MHRICLMLVGFVSLTFMVAGCGDTEQKGVVVHGTLVKNGKPITPAPKDEDNIEIALVPLDKSGNARSAVAEYRNTEGAFTFGGKGSAGVAPGQYKVQLRYIPYHGEQDDRFKEQFTAAATPLKYTVTADAEQHIIIDVGKKTVTKK